jgi:membrane-bound ClpP family serine protease
MLIAGIILLLIGLFAHIGILTTLGIIVLVIGAIFWILGNTGRPVAGRRYWW